MSFVGIVIFELDTNFLVDIYVVIKKKLAQAVTAMSASFTFGFQKGSRK